MKRAAPSEPAGRPGCAGRPRAAVAAAAEAPTALLAAAHRLLTELEGVQRKPPAAAAKRGPEVAAGGGAAAEAAASAERGSHHLGSRLLVALSLIAAADYASPFSLLPSADGGNLLLSLAAFLARLPDTITSLGHAAQVLLPYGICCTTTRHQVTEAVQAARGAAELLDTPEARAAVERQLVRLHAPAAAMSPKGDQHQQQQHAEQPQQEAEQPQQEQQQAEHDQPAASPPLLTVQQLQHACWWRVVDKGGAVLAVHRSPSLLLHSGSGRLSEQQLADIEAAVAAAAAALPALEPANPKGLLAAGSALAALQQPSAAADMYLRALHAAQEQGSSYYELRAAAALLCRGSESLIVAGSGGSLQLSSEARAATAVLVRSGPALRQCEEGLPSAWWLRLRSEVAHGWRAVTTAQAQLNVFKLLAFGMPAKSPAGPVSPRPAGAQQAQRQQQAQQQTQQQAQQQQGQQQQRQQAHQQQPAAAMAAPLPLQPGLQNQAAVAEQAGQLGKQQQVQLVSGHAAWEAGAPTGLCFAGSAPLQSGLCPSIQLPIQLVDPTSQFCSALTHAVDPPAGLNSTLS